MNLLFTKSIGSTSSLLFKRNLSQIASKSHFHHVVKTRNERSLETLKILNKRYLTFVDDWRSLQSRTKFSLFFSSHFLTQNKQFSTTNNNDKNNNNQQRRNMELIPKQVKLLKKERALLLTFENGKQFRYPAEFLRVESPSADVQGHSPGQKRLVSGRRNVAIISIQPVGNYAVQIAFDDLHDTGIFSWQYLYEIGENKFKMMRKYVRALKKAGKSRNPTKPKTNPIKELKK